MLCVVRQYWGIVRNSSECSLGYCMEKRSYADRNQMKIFNVTRDQLWLTKSLYPLPKNVVEQEEQNNDEAYSTYRSDFLCAVKFKRYTKSNYKEF